MTELINKLLDTPDEEIPHVLGDIDVWKWPRSDLNAWIKVLNKFDAMLADIIQEYEVDTLKLIPFPPAIKKKVSEILRFERLLLENSTNRKMFNSYDVREAPHFQRNSWDADFRLSAYQQSAPVGGS